MRISITKTSLRGLLVGIGIICALLAYRLSVDTPQRAGMGGGWMNYLPKDYADSLLDDWDTMLTKHGLERIEVGSQEWPRGWHEETGWHEESQKVFVELRDRRVYLGRSATGRPYYFYFGTHDSNNPPCVAVYFMRECYFEGRSWDKTVRRDYEAVYAIDRKASQMLDELLATIPSDGRPWVAEDPPLFTPDDWPN